MAASVAATAARAAKKRTAKLPNQLRAGAEKVERWKELELTKIMVGKLRVRDMFRAWRLKMALTGSVLQHKQSMGLSDRLKKERDDLKVKCSPDGTSMAATEARAHTQGRHGFANLANNKDSGALLRS